MAKEPVHESQRSIDRRKKQEWRDPDPEVEATARDLCEPGGAIENLVLDNSGADLLRAAAIAERVGAHTHEIAGRLAREAVEQAAREGVSKRQTHIALAQLLGRARSTVEEKLKLY